MTKNDDVSGTPPERLSDNLTAEQIEQWMEGARDPNGHPGWHPATNRDIHDLCELALRAIRSETTDIEALKRDAARWREHAKIMKECAREEAVHFRITKHHSGKVWGVEYVFSHTDLSAVGEELAAARVGEAAALKYRQLTRSFEEPTDVAR